MKVSRYKTMEILKATHGKIFSCEFVKKDGSLRKMVARLGVAKNLKGGKNGAGANNALVTVYDMAASGYRMINLSTLRTIKVAGVTYEVV